MSATRFIAAAAAVLAVWVTGCADDPAENADALCGGDYGVGMRVEGRAQPLEVCVSDADVSALVTSESRYDIAAEMHTTDGTFQVRMVFAQRDDFPVSLRIVDTLADAIGDPSAVWIRYEELPVGGEPVESVSSTGGTFRLSFSDDDVAVGFFENVRLAMEDVLDGDPAGERRIVRGEFSVSAEPATASSFTLDR